MSGSWQAQPERGSPLALRCIIWIALRIGRPVARILRYPICLYFLLTARTARRASRQFLPRAGVRHAGIRHVLRHLHTFGAVVLDRVYFLRGETRRFDLRLHLDPRADAALGNGEGALLLGSHLGSFDALRALAITGHRVPLRVLMRHEHNRLITRLLEALDPRVSETVIPIGRPDTLLRSKEWVDAGGTVALLGDRADQASAGRRRLVHCRFLGRDTLLPSGPLRLAATLDVPVMLFFGLYRGGNRYDIHLEWFADRGELPRDDDEALAAEVRRYAERLEAYVCHAPYNWFNFYDFWAQDDTAAPLATAAHARHAD
ncbi:MAG: lipid A biosynthesis acyltransferase [Halofilum sp. (in: g-proteobacteria)]